MIKGVPNLTLHFMHLTDVPNSAAPRCGVVRGSPSTPVSERAAMWRLPFCTNAAVETEFRKTFLALQGQFTRPRRRVAFQAAGSEASCLVFLIQAAGCRCTGSLEGY